MTVAARQRQTALAQKLRAFLDAYESAPTIIGVDDCGPWVLAWILAASGRVVAFPPYATRDEGRAILARAGGLADFIAPRFADAGLCETPAPEFGGVAVVTLSRGDTAAICCHGGIMAIRGETTAYCFLRPRAEFILRCWALPPCG